ncbi:MAG TPA: hypothetical protein VN457_02740 [Chlamydiales bacterium]|nr:hypothetical protein [Chlamydiales bacterium]
MEKLEGDAKIQAIVGNTQTGKSGLGFHIAKRKAVDSEKERRHQLVLLMRKEAEQSRIVALEKYQMQASWLQWGLDEMADKDFTWQKIFTGYSDKLLKFVLNANLNTLATPDNLRRWNKIKDAYCGLCTQGFVTLQHVLAGCPWVRNVENKLNREDRNT